MKYVILWWSSAKCVLYGRFNNLKPLQYEIFSRNTENAFTLSPLTWFTSWVNHEYLQFTRNSRNFMVIFWWACSAFDYFRSNTLLILIHKLFDAICKKPIYLMSKKLIFWWAQYLSGIGESPYGKSGLYHCIWEFWRRPR